MVLAGQKQGMAYLDYIISSGKTPPAILIYGPPGCGKGYAALQFAGDYLCQAAQAGSGGACGECVSCKQFASLRHPDFIYFSARPIMEEMRALLVAAEHVSFEKLRIHVARFLYKTEKFFSAGLSDIKKKSSSKKSKGSVSLPSAEVFMEQFYEMEKSLLTATDKDGLFVVLEGLLQYADSIKSGLLPVSGVRKIIDMLARKPMLSGRRIVLIEGAELLRKEAANAFLKTLEEPPPGTLLVLAASNIRHVLPTIKSRCALVPFKKMRAAEMEQLAKEEFGVADPPPAVGVHWFYDYLRQYDGSGRKVHQAAVVFFESVDRAEYDAELFAYFKDLDTQELVIPLLDYLLDLITETLLARELGCGTEKILVRMLNGYGEPFLRGMAKEIESLMNDIGISNLNGGAALASVFMGFYLEGCD